MESKSSGWTNLDGEFGHGLLVEAAMADAVGARVDLLLDDVLVLEAAGLDERNAQQILAYRLHALRRVGIVVIRHIGVVVSVLMLLLLRLWLWLWLWLLL